MFNNPEPLSIESEKKEAFLKEHLRGLTSVAVAFSGGVDSAYLADVAHEVLGENAHIVLADSPSIPRSELKDASELAPARGWNFHIVKTFEYQNEQYQKNDGTRCYHCKLELFRVLKEYAAEHHVVHVAYGANMDDLKDPTRLGSKAAEECGAIAPLQLAGMTKENIRILSAKRHLPTADKPSFACLASRFPKGTTVTVDGLEKVEKAEEVLKALGFRQYRVRHHGELCRIEVELSDFEKFLQPQVRGEVIRNLNSLGYRFVTLDLAGYRTGSTA